MKLKTERRQCRFTYIANLLFIISCIAFIVGNVYLDSYESNINKKAKDVAEEKAALQTEIDSLNVSITEKTNFQRVYSIAKKNGLYYNRGLTKSYIAINEDN